jgi:hypothetical protein
MESSVGMEGSRRRVGLLLLLGAGLGTLTGCGPKRLKADFKNFEMAYAETSNHEVLLNLARLQNRDPTYFFKLGQITSQYRMNATLAGNGSYINSGTAAPGFGNVTGGGNPSLLYENDPTFTFIPVNDETNAQLLLQPVPAETFYDLYQQGWRIDQLFRLLVDRVEYTIPTATGCQVVTLHNVPPATLSSSANAKAELSQYVTFLRVSALMYALQKHGHLLLKGNSNFVPVDPNSFVPNDANATAAMDAAVRKADDAKDKAAPGARATGNGPAVKDMLDAAAKEQSWRLSPDGTRWILGKTTLSAQFYLNPLLTPDAKSTDKSYLPDIEAIRDDIKKDADFKELLVGPAMENSLKFLENGFSIEGVPGPQTGNPCTASPHLYLRSLLGLMAAAAQEEAPFESLLQNQPPVPPSLGEPPRGDMTFNQLVPEIERLPALRIVSVADANTKEDSVLTVVSYNRKTYQIADVTSNVPPENLYWNRDMFRLIGQLTSQVTVDISKFPLPTTLQLHQ